MGNYLLIGPAASKIKGVDVMSLTKPVESADMVIYTNIQPKSYEDIFRLYHYAIYPHYLNNIPAVYAIPNPSALFKKLESISDPAPISCPLTGEKAVRHLNRMMQLKEMPNMDKFNIAPQEDEITTPLDPEQTQAAAHFKGQALVIAPAGSGKTTTLVAHNILLVQRGIKPDRILNITFTKKAQTEMEGRLRKSLGGIGNKITVKTYHALAYMLMKDFLGKNPDIIQNRRNILRDLINENEYPFRPEQADSFISFHLNDLKMPHEVEIENTKENKLYIEIFVKYLESLDKNSQTDHDYMLMQLYQMLRDDPAKRHALMDYSPEGENSRYPKGRFQCVAVDEVQDNNLSQLILTRLFVAPFDNLFAVGDEDQLLYSFRGSSIERILNLNETYPHLKEIYLKTNYRCHPEITWVSDILIKGNTMRRQKIIVSGRGDTGKAVKIYAFDNMYSELTWIAHKIKDLIQSGKNPEDIAILYRTNAQGDAAAVCLKELDLPCMVHKNGNSLFESAEAEAMVNHLALIYNPNNIQALLGCLRTPYRTDKVQKYEEALAGTVYPLDILRNAASNSKDWRVAEFCDNINTGRLIVKSVQNMGQAINYIRNKFTDIDKFFCGSDDADRLSILEGIAAKFKTADEFITWVRRVKALSKTEKKNKDNEKVQLMTVHTSKGMEFDTVFLMNCTEGHFPHSKSCTIEALEEERRVFYVGITRAIDALYMTGYQDASKYLSRFIEAIVKGTNLPVEIAPPYKKEITRGDDNGLPEMQAAHN